MEQVKFQIIENIESTLPLYVYEVKSSKCALVNNTAEQKISEKEVEVNSIDDASFLTNILTDDEENEDYIDGKTDDQLQDLDIIEGTEGREQLVLHLKKERNQKFMKKCKRLFALRDKYLHCEICGFSFYETYGDIGKDFIEGHHIHPIFELSIETKFKSSDILMVCSNCHRMIHRQYPCLTKEKIIELIKANKHQLL